MTARLPTPRQAGSAEVVSTGSVHVPGGGVWPIPAAWEKSLSSPTTATGRLQRAALALMLDHNDVGTIPTSIRFLFYELVSCGAIAKKPAGSSGRQPSADLSVALMVLRRAEIVPWNWIVDETRNLTSWRFAPTVAEYLADTVPAARIDLWRATRPPLVIVESRSLSGVLRATLAEYLVPVASTNGQVGGFLHTDVVPLLKDNLRQVLYLGDLDRSGADIEANTMRELEGAADRSELEDEWERLPITRSELEDEWERLAITEQQVEEYGLEAKSKLDRRDGKTAKAFETEALKQEVIVGLVRDRLDELLPEPLDDVLVREDAEREAARERLV